MQEDITSQNSLPGALDVGTPDGSEAASIAVKDVLAQALGKEFSSDEDALKSVKDTYQYVGKAGKGLKAIEAVMSSKGLSEDDAVKFIMDSTQPTPEPVVPAQATVDDSKFISRAEFEEKTFYAEKPELAPYKEILGALKAQNPDKSLSEVAELDSFKAVYSKAKTADEFEQSKSVLSTNPRLGQATDKLTQAREAAADGKVAAAANIAADAVIEAFEL